VLGTGCDTSGYPASLKHSQLCWEDVGAVGTQLPGCGRCTWSSVVLLARRGPERVMRAFPFVVSICWHGLGRPLSGAQPLCLAAEGRRGIMVVVPCRASGTARATLLADSLCLAVETPSRPAHAPSTTAGCHLWQGRVCHTYTHTVSDGPPALLAQCTAAPPTLHPCVTILNA
jgi:hypothetical protein